MKEQKAGRHSYGKLVIQFFVALVVFSLLGAVVAMGVDRITGVGHAMLVWLKANMNMILVVLLVAALIVGIAGHFILRHWAKTEENLQDEDLEEDAISYKIDFWYYVTMLLMKVFFMLDFITFTVGLSLRYSQEAAPRTDMLDFAKTMALFLAIAAIAVVYEVGGVRLLQRRDPSKKGDPGSYGFSKQWMESCDEAEKMMHYKSAYQTVQFMNVATLVIGLIATWGAMVFQTGVMAVFAVCILWILLNVVSSIYYLKLKKSKLD